MTRLLTENLGLKLMSLSVAFLLWVAVVGEQELASTIDVPVEYRNFPKSLDVSSGTVNRVNLLVRGPSGKMNDAFLKDLAVVVDLQSVMKSGEYTFNLANGAVQVPNGLTLERLTPSQIRMTFEDRYAKDVPVQVRYAGNPMPGYRIAKHELYPAQMRVVGPRSKVQQTRFIETDPIDLNGIISETEVQVNTFVEDQQLRVEGPSSVRVRLILERIGGNLEQ